MTTFNIDNELLAEMNNPETDELVSLASELAAYLRDDVSHLDQAEASYVLVLVAELTHNHVDDIDPRQVEPELYIGDRVYGRIDDGR